MIVWAVRDELSFRFRAAGAEADRDTLLTDGRHGEEHDTISPTAGGNEVRRHDWWTHYSDESFDF